MTYTSEQYKYLLMKHLQRYFSLKDEADRYYTINFFGQLFDGATVTEESYDAFISQLNSEIDFCEKNNIRTVGDLNDVDESIVEEKGLLLANAFAKIGIECVIDKSAGTITFTKQNGDVMTYKSGYDENYFYINTGMGMEYEYAKLCSPYYRMEDLEIIGLDEIDYKQCGQDCYWSYDADTLTMTISGNGTFYYAPTDTQLGAGEYSTIIFGANVSAITGGGSIDTDGINTRMVTTVVLLHASDAALELVIPFSYNNRTTVTIDVYTDNETFRNYDRFPSNYVTINWHTLDEWDG